MSKFKRLLVLGVLGLLAAMALAAPAQANGVKAVCEIEGNAKVTDKLQPVPAENPPIGARIMGGEGTYKFEESLIVCEGTAKGEPFVVELDVETQGAYLDIFCGTGKAWSKPDAAGRHIHVRSVTTRAGNNTKTVAHWQALIGDEAYAVEYVASVGEFYWQDSDKDTTGKLMGPVFDWTHPEPLRQKDPPAMADWDLAGVIQLGPPHNKTDLPRVGYGECTKAFGVTGSVMIDEVQ